MDREKRIARSSHFRNAAQYAAFSGAIAGIVMMLVGGEECGVAGFYGGMLAGGIGWAWLRWESRQEA